MAVKAGNHRDRACRRLLLSALSAVAFVVAEAGPAHAADPAIGCAKSCAQQASAAGSFVLAQASTLDAQTVDKYGAALGLGKRAGQYSADIATIRDALARGDKSGATAGIQSLYAKAGHLIPAGQALDQLLAALQRLGAAPSSTAGLGPGLPAGGTTSSNTNSGSSNATGSSQPVGGSTSSSAASSASSNNSGPNMPLGGSSPSAGSSSSSGPQLPLGASAGSSSSSTSNGSPGSNQPTGAASSSPTTGNVLPPPTFGNCGTGTGAKDCGASAASAASSGCDPSSNAALTSLDDLVGSTWTDDQGEKITITRGPGTTIYWQGQHTWIGTFDAGKLQLSRYPEAKEMGDAPEWARNAAAAPPVGSGGPTAPLGGTLATPAPAAQPPAAQPYVKWELELDAKSDCGQPELVGKWYPGEFKWSEEFDARGAAIESTRKVADIGRGKPVDVRYFRAPPVIVGVSLLENQLREDWPGVPFFVYPFQPGASDSGGALSARTLFVYGVDLPRGSNFTITSDDPTVSYSIYAPQRYYEINRLYLDPFQRGLSAAQAARDWRYSSDIAAMDALLLRVGLHKGVLPGIKSFRINGGAAGSWELRFSDDVALVSFARASDGSLAPPSELRPEEVQLTQFLYKPERLFIEVRTKAAFPLDSIPLRVGVDKNKISWNGGRTIAATRIPGSTTVYRTPPIELVLPGRIWKNEPGVFFLPTDGDRIFAAIENPWLLRHDPAEAKLLNGPGDLGHGFNYYLRRAALADKIDPIPDVSDADGWRQLSGHTATKLYNIALLTGYLGNNTRPRTWKQWLIDTYAKVNHPLFYYFFHADDVVLSVNVTVAEHAALLYFRDTFVEQMNTAIDQWGKLLDDYKQDKNSAAMRGLRDYLRANAWNDDSIWRYVGVSCPGGQAGYSATGILEQPDGSGSCSVAYALSDTFLDKTFPQDRAAADRWSIGATAEGVKTVLDAAKAARDNASALAETDFRGLLKILGRNYEPLLPHIVPRLMRRDESGIWVPDTAALYSLKELHQLTDAVVAQEELSRADKIAVLKLALAPLVIMAAPALIAEEAVATAVVNWGLFATDAVLDVSEAYFQLPDVRFALGASLALGAEQLSDAITQRENTYFKTVEKLAQSALLNVVAGEIVVPAILHYGRSGAAIVGRPAVEAVRRGGLAAFKKLSLKAQEAVLAAFLRAKAVEQEAALAFAGAFERDAVVAADRLAAEAGISPPTPTPEPVIAATATPLAKAETVSVKLPAPEEIDGEVVRLIDESGQSSGSSGSSAGGGVVLPSSETTTLPSAPKIDPSVQLARRWRGAPKANSKITLMENPDAARQEFALGNRLGEPGAYVWTLELSAIDGQQMPTAEVLKLAGVADYEASVGGGHDMFRGWEMVTNSQAGYKLVTERTSIRVLKTNFYPQGVQVAAPGKLTPMPFMEQEALGPRRELLDTILKKLGGPDKMPEGLQEKLAEMWGEFKRGGIYPQDLNWKNVWVELTDPNMSWDSFYKAGDAPVDVGLLDFDRMVLWDDYIGHRAGKMGVFLNWVELYPARGKVLSMAPVYGSEQNSWLWNMSQNDINIYINEHPGPYWTDELDYALEKQMEYHNYVHFEPSSGQVTKYVIDPKYLKKYFPRFNDSSRFEPFPLGQFGGGQIPATQQLVRRRRPGQVNSRSGRSRQGAGQPRHAGMAGLRRAA